MFICSVFLHVCQEESTRTDRLQKYRTAIEDDLVFTFFLADEDERKNAI